MFFFSELTCFLDNLVVLLPCITMSFEVISIRCSQPLAGSLSCCSILVCKCAIQGAESIYRKHKFTLWQLILPLSSRAITILCLNSCLLTCARHLSRFLCNLNFKYIERKIAPAFNTNQAMPSPKRTNPVRPENNRPNRTKNASVIQTTKILL